tara:strand:+ start:2441 stop:2698 length:258 start_codon:yes stop_codon:yes gene_type:complete
MFSSFLEVLFSVSLFLFGGNILDTKLSLHHFEDSDYKDIFFLKNKQSTVKKCTKHSIFENIEKIHRYNSQGSKDTVYKITNPEEN